MDVFLAVYPADQGVIQDQVNHLLKEISPSHTLLSNDKGIFHLWKSERGESTYLENESVEIWFDGYIHSTGYSNSSEFVFSLAQRIVKKGVVLQGEESGIFNILIRDKLTGAVYLANDPSGFFPIYYTLLGNSFIVCSHLYILAQAINARPDYLQLAFKEAFGYAIGIHTYFQEIKRLAAGELLIYDSNTHTSSSRFSEAYYTQYQDSGQELVEVIYQALKKTIKDIAEHSLSVGIMLSEGFDSRLIAALFRQVNAKVFSFTHGTSGTKGMRISQQAGQALGLNHHFEEAVFPSDAHELRRQLLLSDNLHIPYWKSGSEYFRQNGIDVTVAGTSLDSTLGGHIFYPPNSDRFKAVVERYQEIVTQNLGGISDQYIENLSSELLQTLLAFNTSRLERRIHERFTSEIANEIVRHIGEMRDCINSELERLIVTGSSAKSLLLQRFYWEHQCRRFESGQELTLRINNRVVIPSLEAPFMRQVSQVRPQEKIHHKIYLRLLNRFVPEATTVRTGNYSLPSTFPRIFLETSRFLGKYRDLKTIKTYLASQGKSDYTAYRASLFQDNNGRNPRVLDYFYSFFDDHQAILNKQFYKGYLDRVRTYQARVFNLADFYRAIEFCQILSSQI